MSDKGKGKLYYCDGRDCDAFVFLKSVGEGEMDGGYTRWNKFEDFPDGWCQYSLFREKGYGGKYVHLCPKCTQKLTEPIRQAERIAINPEFFENNIDK